MIKELLTIHMRQTMRALLLFTTAVSFLGGCKDIYEQDKYQNPEWLAGKLFTQVEEQENLTLFAECLRRVGMDTVLNVSGSFTVFAPSDQALNDYLSEKGYSDVSAIPMDELNAMVRFHILQNAWSRDQFSKLDVGGWIDPTDPESEPRAYKRQTLHKNPNEKYWVRSRKDEEVIVLDSSSAQRYKKVFTRSRKYAPIFFDDFFEVHNLSYSDYSFYFGREFEPGNIFFGDAKVVQSEIFAENGYVYVVDRVVEPMRSAKEMLERELPGESYRVFLELIYQFPEFRSNLQETYDQQEARAGLNFDTLYNLTFPKLPFNIHEELTGPSINVENYTYLYHNAVYVPTDIAFQKFLDEVVTSQSGYPHWNSFDDMPAGVKQIIVQSHFRSSPVYLSDITSGFEDENGNRIFLDEGRILRKEFGSNCTFLGLDQTVVPRAFSSITGPVYLRPGFSLLLYAIEYTKILNAISKADKEYCFFAIPDASLALDSSLFLDWIDRELEIYRFKAYSMSDLQFVGMPAGELGKRILNQVGTSVPTGSADKEFIESLGGKMIVWNNVENTVQGSKPNVFGYNGDSIITLIPQPLEEPVDNGQTYQVDGWFSNTSTSMFAMISSYPQFRNLLEKAGMYDPQSYGFPFLTEGSAYTIFMPSASALTNYGADTLSVEELKAFLRYHFVRGERIYTDNKKLWGEYETMRRDESSTAYNTYYSTLNIRPGRDVIEILDEEGEIYTSVNEGSGANKFIYYDTDKSPESTSSGDLIITAVLHEIDTVLVKH